MFFFFAAPEEGKIYDAYISYARVDSEFATELSSQLNRNNISVYFDALMLIGKTFEDQIAEAIRNSRYHIVLLSENSLNSQYVYDELKIAIEAAKERNKVIIPVFLTSLPEFDITKIFQGRLADSSFIKPEEGKTFTPEEVATIISSRILSEKRSSLLLEKLSDYQKMQDDEKTLDALVELLDMRYEELRDNDNSNSNIQQSILFDILQYAEQLFQLVLPIDDSDWNISEQDGKSSASALGEKKNRAGSDLLKILSYFDPEEKDLYRLSMAIRLIFLSREIRMDGVDAMTHGDVFAGAIDPFPMKDYQEKQKPYVISYYQLIDEMQFSESHTCDYLDRDVQFILATKSFIYGDASYKNPNENPALNRSKEKETKAISENDELYLNIAEFMKKGNEIFDKISDRIEAEDFQRCLLTSYDRLKNYCEIVGATKIGSECIDRIAELNNKAISAKVINSDLSENTTDNNTEAEEFSTTAQDSIRALLGLSIPNKGEYDVFLSYNHEDVDLAENVCEFLERKLCSVFFDKKTLPELAESDYKKAIMNALDHSKNFIVILSDLEHLKSRWVQLEMSTFEFEKSEGRKEGSNFLFIATNRVYEEIMRDKTCLDIEYRKYEVLRMNEYQQSILNYVMKNDANN